MSQYQQEIEDQQNNYDEEIQYNNGSKRKHNNFAKRTDSDMDYDEENHQRRIGNGNNNHNAHSRRNGHDYNETEQGDVDHQDHEQEENDNSSEERSDRSSSNSQEVELTQEQKLENEILEIAINNEQSSPYQNELTIQLFEKLKDYKYIAKSKTGEDLITAKIQELVINKLLVLTYNKSEFRLILAHFHLGQAYLLNECIEQSIEHISVALHKIEKLFESIPETRLLQTHMQNELAKALIQKENYEDAIQLLTQSVNEENRLKELRKHQTEQENVKNTKALVLLSQCYAKITEYDQAINVIDEVIAITRKKKMAKEEYSFALVEKAKILALQKKFIEAITHQQEAIDILMEENYSKPEEVAELYTVLSSYHEEINSIQNSLTCIQKVKTLYQELYSAEDKRVIKARRKIATFLLKSERFKQAVNELLQVVELEEKVFGQNSLQTARTLKLLGAVYISMEVADARAYLKRALNIFQSHGIKKQVQQIRDKLKMLYNGGEDGAKDVRVTGSQHEI